MQSACVNDDQCCPAGCTPDQDSDCSLPNHMFVTSTTYAGNFGGLAGADARCNERARIAGLSGSFVAFLSTISVPAVSRLEGSSGWVLADGQPFANTVEDIRNGKLFYPPRVDEFGKLRPGNETDESVYTGTKFDGSPNQWNCANWTSSAAASQGGSYNATKDHWLWYWGAAEGSCGNAYHIYCFEVGRKAIVVPRPPMKGARIAFVAEGFVPTIGLDGADRQCSEAARSAALEGEFLAFLATSKASAASRFNLSGPPWVRPDGIPIVATAVDITTGNLLAPVSVRADGSPYTLSGDVWTGAATPEAPGIATCVDWTSSDSMGGTAFANFASAKWFGVSTTPCTASLALYCFQR
jgi:Protein of unknown function (DUF1554)